MSSRYWDTSTPGHVVADQHQRNVVGSFAASITRGSFRAFRGVSRPSPMAAPPASASVSVPPQRMQSANVPAAPHPPRTLLKASPYPQMLPPDSSPLLQLDTLRSSKRRRRGRGLLRRKHQPGLIPRLSWSVTSFSDGRTSRICVAVKHLTRLQSSRFSSWTRFGAAKDEEVVGSFAASINRDSFRAFRGVSRPPPMAAPPASASGFVPPQCMQSANVPAAPPLTHDSFGSVVSPTNIASGQLTSSTVGHASEQQKTKKVVSSFAASINRGSFRAFRGVSRPPPMAAPHASASVFVPPQCMQSANVPAAPPSTQNSFESVVLPSYPQMLPPDSSPLLQASEQQKTKKVVGSFAASINRGSFRAFRGVSRASPTAAPPASASVFVPSQCMQSANVPAAPPSTQNSFESVVLPTNVASGQLTSSTVGASEQQKTKKVVGSFAASINRGSFRAFRGVSRASPTAAPPASASVFVPSQCMQSANVPAAPPSTQNSFESVYPQMLPPDSSPLLQSDTLRSSRRRRRSWAPSPQASTGAHSAPVECRVLLRRPHLPHLRRFPSRRSTCGLLTFPRHLHPPRTLLKASPYPQMLPPYSSPLLVSLKQLTRLQSSRFSSWTRFGAAKDEDGRGLLRRKHQPGLIPRHSAPRDTPRDTWSVACFSDGRTSRICVGSSRRSACSLLTFPRHLHPPRTLLKASPYPQMLPPDSSPLLQSDTLRSSRRRRRSFAASINRGSFRAYRGVSRASPTAAPPASTSVIYVASPTDVVSGQLTLSAVGNVRGQGSSGASQGGSLRPLPPALEEVVRRCGYGNAPTPFSQRQSFIRTAAGSALAGPYGTDRNRGTFNAQRGVSLPPPSRQAHRGHIRGRPATERGGFRGAGPPARARGAFHQHQHPNAAVAFGQSNRGGHQGGPRGHAAMERGELRNNEPRGALLGGCFPLGAPGAPKLAAAIPERQGQPQEPLGAPNNARPYPSSTRGMSQLAARMGRFPKVWAVA
ncbi:hypothetical protein L596_001029 [Steinernema carpocapsae]|uniref:Uncharacterized protein n=1 Tax=Steinernema carpocapsae TaxID=34508 RepID=A0A4U8UJT5_STECR|nr:hypothetical protein L596_001029 [Steinernema carpocapsae]